MTETRTWRLYKICLLLFIAFSCMFLYTFLHEGGHAITAILFGGRVTAFNINFLDISAHVGVSGSFTPAQTLVQIAAGAGLPFLVWLIFIVFVPKRANPAIEIVKICSTLGVLSSLLAWIVIPFLYLQGIAPRDDVTSFLSKSGIPPLLLSGICVALWVGGWVLFLSRIPSVREEIALLRKSDEVWLTPGVRKSVGGMVGILTLCGFVALGANGFRLTGRPRSRPPEPPAGYHLVRTFDLGEATHMAELVLTFTLAQSQEVGIFLLISDIDTPYFQVELTGPQGYKQIIIQAKGYSSSRDSALLERELWPGTYHLLLTSARSPGKLAIYTRDIPIR